MPVVSFFFAIVYCSLPFSLFDWFYVRSGVYPMYCMVVHFCWVLCINVGVLAFTFFPSYADIVCGIYVIPFFDLFSAYPSLCCYEPTFGVHAWLYIFLSIIWFCMYRRRYFRRVFRRAVYRRPAIFRRYRLYRRRYY